MVTEAWGKSQATKHGSFIMCVCPPLFLQKSKASRKPSTAEQLEEKDERIRHLEAVNITLKQTNDDLNEEVTELRRQLTEQTEKVCSSSNLHCLK